MAKSKPEEQALAAPTAGGIMAPAANESLPDFMQGVESEGTEDLAKHITPPRLKIVQRTADETLSARFDMGDTIITPQNILVAPVKKNEQDKPDKTGEPFCFVPLLFFPEWIVTNPIELKGQGMFIRDRTLDPKSPIAVKARNPETWFEPHPDQPNLQIRYVEVLNFIVVLVGVPGFEGLPMVMSFAKAEHKAGNGLATLIKMRRAPIYGCVFQARTGHRKNAKGEWYGWDCDNPRVEGVQPFVQSKDDFELLKTEHAKLKDSIINVTYDVDEVHADESVDLSEDAQF